MISERFYSEKELTRTPISENVLKILEARYLLKDKNGKVIETPDQMYMRVARNVAIVEYVNLYIANNGNPNTDKNEGRLWGEISESEARVLKHYLENDTFETLKGVSYEQLEKFISMHYSNVPDFVDDMYGLMRDGVFLPNSPTLMNAGTSLGQLSACFVLPVGDSIEEIFDAVKNTAIIHKTGGGTGFSFSRLRGSGGIVGSTKGVASGAVSFMKVFDTTTEVIKQGGKRRGANMAVLRYDHPDIMEFITAKDKENTILRNFNISVGMDKKFFDAYRNGGDIELIDPHTKEVTGRVSAKEMWDKIVKGAHTTGDPGLIFLDNVNKTNPVKYYGEIEATNPCITGDTFVYTASGIKRARDLYLEGNPLKVVTDKRTFGSKFQNASNMIMTGVKPVIKIRTKEGFKIRLTRDHLVYSDERGWVSAGELKIGEKIRILSNEGGFGTSGSLEEGRVLGWLVGDGHINKGLGNKRAVLSFYNTDRPLAPKFAEYVNDLVRDSVYNRSYEVGVVNVESRNVSTVASERLKEYAVQIGLGENKLRVPDAVMTGNAEMQKGFLQGLFEADGTVSIGTNSRYSVRLTSISEDMLQEVQVLLLNFGIYSRIYRNRRKAGVRKLPDSHRMSKEYPCQAYHELSIGRESILKYAEKIGFLSPRKNERLQDIINSYIESPRKEKWSATVESLEYDGTEEVFDLIEPVTHTFIANGIIIHNCGEQPLLPNESCNLGSINLAKFVTFDEETRFDYSRFGLIIEKAVRFLDDVIDANFFPLDEIARVTRSTRKIGLGVMGYADALEKMGIPYDSEEGVKFGEEIARALKTFALFFSMSLAKERGVFPLWKEEAGFARRNSTVTTIAPTGTISRIAECSSGIEPFFALAYHSKVLDGQVLYDINKDVLKEIDILAEGDFISAEEEKEILKYIEETGTLPDIEVLSEIKKLFKTAGEISGYMHVEHQKAFQKWIDSGVSKTINLPSDATEKDISEVYLQAYEGGCKGITVYRDNSKVVQVLNKGNAVDLKLSIDYDPNCKSGSCNI